MSSLNLSMRYIAYSLLKPLEGGYSEFGTYGFIETGACDSLLWTSLIGCDQARLIDLWNAFEKKTGRWMRRPIVGFDPCYPKCSTSTISRDMLLGLAWNAWCKRDLELSESVVKYAIRHLGKMGDGTLGQVMISPSLLSTFANISHQCGGPSRAWLRLLPGPPLVANKTGYERHLHLLHVALRDRVLKQDNAKELAEDYLQSQPNNQLIRVLAGLPIDETIINKYFPMDRLPTAKDRKEPWLWQRDEGEDWQPDPDSNKVHSGGDFIFLYMLANGVI